MIIIVILGVEKTVTPVARTVGHALRASTVATVPVITAKHATHVARTAGHAVSIVETGYVIMVKTAALANGIVVHAQNSVVGLPQYMEDGVMTRRMVRQDAHVIRVALRRLSGVIWERGAGMYPASVAVTLPKQHTIDIIYEKYNKHIS